MLDEATLKQIIKILKAEQRLQYDAEDADDCRREGNSEGWIDALEFVIKSKVQCPVCWELKKEETLDTHVCYADEEDVHCYACGETFEKGGRAHALVCEEDRY